MYVAVATMLIQETDRQYMEIALQEAAKGLGRTSPNPVVGAVVVRDGQVVGQGYHQCAGTPHAEVHALHDAGEKARGATLYVTLEPCNHSGRTPPCTAAILRAGIREVVIGMPDPNPHVVGGGAVYLQEQGIAVRQRVLEEQCRALNYPFLKHSATGLPWVMMKAALSLDGRISYRIGQNGRLSGAQSTHFVHHLRNQCDAILIGVGTALVDNPSLSTRLDGVTDQRDPLRIILDSQLRLPVDAQMLCQRSNAETWIFCAARAFGSAKKDALEQAGAKVFCLAAAGEGERDETGLNLGELLYFLGQANITSLLVEGGSHIHGAFWQQQLFDEILLCYVPFLIGDQGTPLAHGVFAHSRPPLPPLERISTQILGNDVLYRGLLAHSAKRYALRKH